MCEGILMLGLAVIVFSFTFWFLYQQSRPGPSPSWGVRVPGAEQALLATKARSAWWTTQRTSRSSGRSWMIWTTTGLMRRRNRRQKGHIGAMGGTIRRTRMPGTIPGTTIRSTLTVSGGRPVRVTITPISSTVRLQACGSARSGSSCAECQVGANSPPQIASDY